MTTRVLLPAVAAALFLATGCATNREAAYRKVQAEELEAKIAWLERRLDERTEAPAPKEVDDRSDQVGRELDFADVEMRGDELVIGIASDILFRPGQADLSADAKAKIGRVVQVVNRRYPGNYVRVEGHTDSDPIVRHKDKWRDNWHLSAMRAHSVLQEMIGAGISEKKAYLAGFGQHRPLASNANREGKAKNRRVEIVVLPKR